MKRLAYKDYFQLVICFNLCPMQIQFSASRSEHFDENYSGNKQTDRHIDK